MTGLRASATPSQRCWRPQDPSAAVHPAVRGAAHDRFPLAVADACLTQFERMATWSRPRSHRARPAAADPSYGSVKPDCRLRMSSITQVTHTSRAITPDTAAKRATMRPSISRGLISFMGRAWWCHHPAVRQARLASVRTAASPSPAPTARRRCPAVHPESRLRRRSEAVD